MKRKEEPDDPAASQGKTAKVEADDPGAGVTRQPAKRPITRNRAMAGGLFSNAMRGVLRSSVTAVKREAKEDEPAPDWGQGQTQRPEPPAARVVVPPPRSQAPTREVLEKAEDLGECGLFPPSMTCLAFPTF